MPLSKFLVLGLVAALGVLMSAPLASAQGGPPMFTDDPGTPGDGHWEINLGSVTQSTDIQSLVQVPYADINYGWGERLQLKLETGAALFAGHQYNGTETNIKAGWGGAIAGTKWRFIGDGDGLSVSTYPQYYFSYFLTSPDPDLGQPGNWFLLPVEFNLQMGKLAFNPDVGYQFEWQGPNEMNFGALFSYKATTALELMFEMHSTIVIGGTGELLLYNAGFRYDFNENSTLMISAGHTVQTLSGANAQLFSWVGIQLRK